MSKRPSFKELAIGSRLAPKATQASDEAPAETITTPVEPPAPAAPRSRDFKTMMCRVNRAGWQEMSRLAIDEERNLEDLLIEACNDLLRKRGRPPVVEKRYSYKE